MGQLWIRKAASITGGGIAAGSLVLLSLTGSPFLAMLGMIGTATRLFTDARPHSLHTHAIEHVLSQATFKVVIAAVRPHSLLTYMPGFISCFCCCCFWCSGVTLGNSFGQSSFTPNYIEVAGPDVGYFGVVRRTVLP